MIMSEIPVTYEIGSALLEKYGSVRKAVDHYLIENK
jgi:N-acetylmuramic acid 6-phosphate etherase